MFNPPTFSERIIGMMKDYDITMFDSLLWDFESFYGDANEMFWKNGKDVLENTFNQYLCENGVAEDYCAFYTDIFMGRSENMELKSNAEEKKY